MVVLYKLTKIRNMPCREAVSCYTIRYRLYRDWSTMLKAVVYDFDGTLTPDALPKFAILEKCGLENGTQTRCF